MVWTDFLSQKEDRALTFNKKKIKFLADENFYPEATNYIHEKGWNIKDIKELSANGFSDENIFALAYKQNRVLLTHDTDFLDHTLFPFYKNSGIFIFLGGTDKKTLAISTIDMLRLFAPYWSIYQGSKIIFYEGREIKIIIKNYQGQIDVSRIKLTKNKIFEWK